MAQPAVYCFRDVKSSATLQVHSYTAVLSLPHLALLHRGVAVCLSTVHDILLLFMPFCVVLLHAQASRAAACTATLGAQTVS